MNTTCKICGSKTSSLFDPQFNIDYYQCHKCDFITIDESHIVTMEEEINVYQLHNNSYANEGYVNMFRAFLDKSVVPFVDKVEKALDFGSGPEPVLAKVMEEEYGYQVDTYDVYYSPLKVYEGKQYDLIVSTEVVEHIDDPLKCFKLFKELLKDGGILAIMTLFHPKDDNKFLDWWYRRDITHISFFTPQTMEYIASEIGMKVIYTDGTRQLTLQNKIY